MFKVRSFIFVVIVRAPTFRLCAMPAPLVSVMIPNFHLTPHHLPPTHLPYHPNPCWAYQAACFAFRCSFAGSADGIIWWSLINEAHYFSTTGVLGGKLWESFLVTAIATRSAKCPRRCMFLCIRRFSGIARISSSSDCDFSLARPKPLIVESPGRDIRLCSYRNNDCQWIQSCLATTLMWSAHEWIDLRRSHLSFTLSARYSLILTALYHSKIWVTCSCSVSVSSLTSLVHGLSSDDRRAIEMLMNLCARSTCG